MTATPPSGVVRLCAFCGRREPPYLCQGCRQARYCDAAHQRAHWSAHKGDCVQAQYPANHKTPTMDRSDVLVYVGAGVDTILLEMLLVARPERSRAVRIGCNPDDFLGGVSTFVLTDTAPRRPLAAEWSAADIADEEDDVAHCTAAQTERAASMHRVLCRRLAALGAAPVATDADAPVWEWTLGHRTIEYHHSQESATPQPDECSPRLLQRLSECTILFVRDYQPAPTLMDLLPKLEVAVHNGCYWYPKKLVRHYTFNADYDADEEGGPDAWQHRFQQYKDV